MCLFILCSLFHFSLYQPAYQSLFLLVCSSVSLFITVFISPFCLLVSFSISLFITLFISPSIYQSVSHSRCLLDCFQSFCLLVCCYSLFISLFLSSLFVSLFFSLFLILSAYQSSVYLISLFIAGLYQFLCLLVCFYSLCCQSTLLSAILSLYPHISILKNKNV